MSTTMHTLPDGRQYTPSLEGMPPRSLAPSKAARIVTIVALTFTLLGHSKPFSCLSLVYQIVSKSHHIENQPNQCPYSSSYLLPIKITQHCMTSLELD